MNRKYPTVVKTGTISHCRVEQTGDYVFKKADLHCGDGDYTVSAARQSVFGLLQEAQEREQRVTVTLGVKKSGPVTYYIAYEVEEAAEDEPDSSAEAHFEDEWYGDGPHILADKQPQQEPHFFTDAPTFKPEGRQAAPGEMDPMPPIPGPFLPPQFAQLLDPTVIWKTNMRMALMHLSASVVPPLLIPLTEDSEATAMNIHAAQVSPVEQAGRVLEVYQVLAAVVFSEVPMAEGKAE